MNNKTAHLYKKLSLIAASREVAMMADGKPSQYNLDLGQRTIEEIIEAENEHNNRLCSNDPH